MKLNLIAFLALCLCVIFCSCNKEITVGADLIEDQPINVEFTDALDITAKTVIGDSITTYFNTVNSDQRTFILGAFEDGIYGKASSTIYLTPRASFIVPPFISGASIDSVILTLPIDTIGYYGSENATHDISLFRLSQPIDLESTSELYSNDCLEFESTPLQTLSVVPSKLDTVLLYNPNVDSSQLFNPQLRFKLDKELWEPIFIDSLYPAETQTQLVDAINGYAIQSVPSENSFFSLNLASTSAAEVQVFYTDTTNHVLSFDVNTTAQNNNESSVKHICFEHDYSGSEVGAALMNADNEFNYLQGLQGLDIEYDLSPILNYDDVIINYGVLELFLLEDPDNEPVSFVTGSYRKTDGSLQEIEDLFSFYYDGSVIDSTLNGMPVKKYQLLITSHLINLVNGEVLDPTLTLRSFQKDVNPNRSKIFSPTHPDFPARLRLITTKP